MIRFSFFLFFITLAFASLTYTSEVIDAFTVAHIMEVDPKSYDMVAVRADERDGISRETVFSLVQRNDAIAGVNGGFWKDNGDPAGILRILGTWHGFPKKPRAAIGWENGDNTVIMDQVLTSNMEDKDRDQQGIEVLSWSSPNYTSKESWQKVDYIIGGTPILIRNGKVITDYSIEETIPSFIKKKHSRTAVGIKKNGTWVFVVVDGSMYGIFGGMTIESLANYMQGLGCVDALNLDGGSSSTMVYENAILNFPYGNIYEEGKNTRAVSDAILILEK